MKRLASLLLLLAAAVPSHAAHVDTVRVFSPSMRHDVPALVVTPDRMTRSAELPVVYLLHGHGGSYKSGWINQVPVGDYADRYHCIFVLPDAATDSWYFDSPIDPSNKYETFVAEELVAYVDTHYPTRADRSGRAVTGNSMGGHGALYLAFRHQETFGAAGSTSGGVDIRPFPGNWSMAKWLGPQEEYPENWERNTVINLVHLLHSDRLKLFIDCGEDDFFYEVNRALHEKLRYMNVPHTFLTMPGAHNWVYWRQSIAYQMVFFDHFFRESPKEAQR